MLCYITLCVVFVGFAFGQDEITTAPPPIVYLTDATPGQEQITTAPPPIEFVTEGSSAPEKPIKVCYLYLFIIIDFLFSTTRKTSASHTCSNIKTLHNAATTVQAICRFASDDLVK